MLRLLVIPWLFFAITSIGSNPPGKTYIKTKDGVVFYPDELLSGNAQSVKVQVVAENIIRVVAFPRSHQAGNQSLITVYDSASIPQWELIQVDSQRIILKTRLLSAHTDLHTGTVSFFDSKGQLLLSEKQMGRTLEPVVYEGERSYKISQVFETSPDDAFYGLGQHQDGLFNYKGYQVNFFQNNTEVAVPFLVSKRNYGILWDNYSLTSAGDTRPYKPLSALKLFSKDGQPGWLSTSYANNKDKPSKILLERAESEIKCEYLNDSKILLPADFKPQDGLVVWEGALESDFNGDHKLRFTYGGYIKVWLNDKLLLDRWRQAWNPGSAILNFSFEKGKKYPIRIEWIPNGTESYISLKWLEPAEKKMENTFSFCSEAGKQLDYYIFSGNNMDEVISAYRNVTGKATIVPKWALGLWQSRERYKTQEEVLNTVAEFRKRRIPLDNIVLDWSYWKENEWGSQDFEPARFSNPDSMISILHNKYNTRFMISVWPKFYKGIKTYQHFDQKGWLYKRNIADQQRDWIGKGYISTFYDAFNEGARKAFWDLINEKLFKKGVDAWWMDASEPDILSNVTPQKRKEQMYPLAAGLTAEYLNAYPLENAKGIYEGQREASPNQRVFILTRSAYAGLQRYASAVWSGDIAARWHDMKLQIPAGINLSMSGIPYWTMDIGGFSVEPRYEKPDAPNLDEWRELMTRWYQFGAFTPLFRVHGQYPYREIFNVAPEDHPSYQSMLFYNKLRYRLMPYIYSLAGHTYHRDYTIMRGLVMDFPADEAVTNIGDQYLFGPSLMINPVYDYKKRTRQVYLPAGQGWYDLYSGKHFDGGRNINADAEYERMPVFVKEGSIIPFGPELQYTDEKKPELITLYVYGGKDASFTLYEDEGTNYNYEKGGFSTIEFNYSEKGKTLAINNRAGSFVGMLTNRKFRIIYITKDKPVELNPDNKNGKLVTYLGNLLTVSLK